MRICELPAFRDSKLKSLRTAVIYGKRLQPIPTFATFSSAPTSTCIRSFALCMERNISHRFNKQVISDNHRPRFPCSQVPNKCRTSACRNRRPLCSAWCCDRSAQSRPSYSSASMSNQHSSLRTSSASANEVGSFISLYLFSLWIELSDGVSSTISKLYMLEWKWGRPGSGRNDPTL